MEKTYENIRNILVLKWRTEEGKFITIFVLLMTIGIIFLLITFCIYKLSESSSFGDTISGILGTFINLGAALLIFISFRAQVKANIEISKQVNDERVAKLFDLFNKSELDKDLKKSYDRFVSDCNSLYINRILDYKLFDYYKNLLESIDDKKQYYEDARIIYKAANDAANYKEDTFQKHFLNTMHIDLKPFFWSNGEAKEEAINSVPIIKIDSLAIQIPKTLFNIQQAKGKNISITKLEILRDNRVSKSIYLSKIVNDVCDTIEIKFGRIKPSSYVLKWHIEYNGNMFYYISDKYQIN